MANSCRSRRVFQGRLFATNQSVVTVVHIACVVAVLTFQFSAARGEHSFCNMTPHPSPRLTMFIDPLPIPSTIDTSNGSQVILGAYNITQKLHSDLPATKLYAYGRSQSSATYPGPTLVATRHQASHVRFENHISDNETFLITDRKLHWANPSKGGVPIVTHLHGGECASESDGHPEAWHTPSGERGKAFVTQNYTYANAEPATLLWYHDHTVGISRNNVLAGLAGLYIIRSPSEEPANLPQGANEIPLVIQDKQFWANGSILFPDSGLSNESYFPNWCPRYFGDTILVNGKVWPYLNVFPEKYRFRMLNGANDRFFTLTLSNSSLQFNQIGNEGGFLENTLNLTSLTLPPAYRADVIIDFSNMTSGTTVYLNNSVIEELKAENPPSDTNSTNSVMAFKIISRPQGDRRQDFATPQNIAPVFLPPNDVYKYRNLTLVRRSDAPGVLLNNASFTDPATEDPKLNTTEIWDVINNTTDPHPIHIHLINFRMLHQQAFDKTNYEAGSCNFLPFGEPGSCFIEEPKGPNDMQVGWKDTVIMYSYTVTRIWIRWSPRDGETFPFDPTTGPGYVWHCHLLGHEDNDMMRPLKVTN